MQRLNNMIVIGCSGIARSGKDLYCKIAESILLKHGFISRKYAFADTLKDEVMPFLRDTCGCDVWTDDTETKTDIRDFLVWYGTTWWRKRQPDRWIGNVQKKIQSEKNHIDVVFVSDVRYPNECHWIHSKNGFVVHISKFIKTSLDAGRTWDRKFNLPPNETEEKNDPLVQQLSDFKLQWEDLSFSGGVKININELVNNMYLIEKVTESLQACPNLLPPSMTQTKT